MAVDKPSISIDAELRLEADQIAASEGLSFSAFVSDAVRDAVNRRRASKRLLSVITDWEAEHGSIDSADITAAARELNLAAPSATTRKPKAATAAERSSGAPRSRSTARHSAAATRGKSSATNRKS